MEPEVSRYDTTRDRHEAQRGPESTQVSPVEVASRQRQPRRQSIIVITIIGFSQAFGLFGPPMIAILIVCICWTTWLIMLTIAPNETANYLMGTGSFDNGQFWLIVDPDRAVQGLAVAGLVVVDVTYMYVLGKMTIWRGKRGSIMNRLKRATLRQLDRQSSRHITVFGVPLAAVYTQTSAAWHELTSMSGRNRKFWNVFLKALDLVVQSIQLHQALENGFPVVLVRGYTLFLCCNALSCASTILSARHSAILEIFVDSIFDLIAAVVYPIWVLVYCYLNFDFDRRAFQLNIDLLPPGSFEQMARMAANPSEIAFFRSCFDSLRFLSIGNLVLRLSLNLSFCNRFREVVATLLRAQVKRSPRKAAVHPGEGSEFLVQTNVPKIVAAFFILFAAMVVAYGEKAMAVSRHVCADYPQCIVFAHRWNESKTCPCLELIDVDRSPRTYADWMDPIDMTEAVRTLSKSGDLRVLHLINRGLLQLPDELRHCRNLQYVSLIYTGLEAIPSWASEFKRLQYLHVEGKDLFPNLLSLDGDLFSDMPYLTYLHMAVHDRLQALPSLSGVPSLRSIVFAHMFSLLEVPTFNDIAALQRLELDYLPRLRTVPDLSLLKHIVHFAAFRRSEFCCNGFLGTCDLTRLPCTANPVLDIPAAICLDDDVARATNGTKTLLERFSSSTCQDSKYDVVNATDNLRRDVIDVCGGVRFRQCEYPSGSGQFGICYNNRMQVLTCIINPDIITLRRAQIKLGINPACDPAEEAWLGCK